MIIDDQSTGFYVYTPNITRGGGGAAAAYSDTDWIALLRHGLKPSRTPVFIMPSEDYAQMADEDVAALVTYIRALPPSSERKAEIRMPLLLKALYAFGVIDDAAEKIDHSKPGACSRAGELTLRRVSTSPRLAPDVTAKVSPAARFPARPPTWPAAANLTSAADGAMNRYCIG